MAKYPPGKNPNSLKNLAPLFNKDNAKEMQQKGAVVRKANKEAREALKMSAWEFSQFRETLQDVEISAEMMLKVLMMRAYEEGDSDTAADLAKALVEFEKPKLARIDQTNTDLTAEDLSDEEIDKLLKKHTEENDEL